MVNDGAPAWSLAGVDDGPLLSHTITGMRDNEFLMSRYVLALLLPVLVFGSVGFASLVSNDRPSQLDYRLARGRVMLDIGNYLSALEIFKQAIETNPEHITARTLLGIVQLRMHLYHAAIKTFEEAGDLDRGEAGPFIGLAHAKLALGEVSASMADATHATEVDPQAGEAWLALAQACWRDRSYGDAESAALEARELAPENPRALEALLHIYMDSDKPKKFEALIDDVPEGNQSLQNLVVSFLVRQGEFSLAWQHRARFDRRRTELAILEAELALDRGPSNEDLLPKLISDLVAAGQYERAIEYSTRHTGPEPIDMEVGKAYWMLGDVARAKLRFEAASHHGIHKLSAEVALAIITEDASHWRAAFRAEHPEKDYWVLGQLDGLSSRAPALIKPLIWRYAAIYEPHFYNRAVEDAILLTGPESDNLDILLTVGTAYEHLGRFDEADRYITRAIESHPYAAAPVSRLAKLALQKGESSTVVSLMERAVSLEPSNPGYLYNLGWVYDEMSQDDLAVRLYRQAISASELSFEAMNNLALIYSERGQEAAARSLLEQAIAIDPSSEAAYFNLGRYYSDRKEWKAALEAYGRVLDINPLNAEARLELGRIRLNQGDLEESVDILNTALETNPQYLEAYLLVSLAYERLGHFDAAVGAAEEARRIDPENPELADVLGRLQEDRP